MSFLNGLFNGAQGSGFQAQSANIINPNTNAQQQALFTQAQQGAQGLGTTAQGIQGQLGGANQAAAGALGQQQSFTNALSGSQGIQNQQNVYNQQQQLSNQLQGVANGTGPNPATAQLAQATSANTANQAALMAGQRGSGANAGLIARQAAQQGAANQQNAAGQAATLQAQQSLGAMSQLQGQQANMANLAGTQVNQQQTGLSNLANQAATQQGQLQNQYGFNQSQLQNYNLAQQGQQLAQTQAANNANTAMQSNINSVNGQIANTNAQAQNSLGGGLLGGAGSVLGTIGLAKGGFVNNPVLQQSKMIPFADGGDVTTAATPQAPMNSAIRSQPMSNVAKALSGQANIASSGNDLGAGIASFLKKGFQALTAPGATPDGEPPMPEGDGTNPLLATMGPAFAKGGKVPAMVSPGEIYLNPRQVKEVAQGKRSPLAGEKIKGKAKVKGDSLENDTVPKTLEVGGVVQPKSVTESDDKLRKAHQFIGALLTKNGSLPKKAGK